MTPVVPPAPCAAVTGVGFAARPLVAVLIRVGAVPQAACLEMLRQRAGKVVPYVRAQGGATS
ncbi:hypothetical protein [Streptomyces kanamyceticus]|uniref:hypothetical protein n=1 Tax=Streptomyces kanamyceticus TaxID=1967 RepID=UPI0037DD8C6E